MSENSSKTEASPEATCKALAKRLVKARKTEAEIWTKSKSAMKAAHKDGLTYAQIAEIFGFTKARVYQIVTGKRGNGKSVAAFQKKSA